MSVQAAKMKASSVKDIVNCKNALSKALTAVEKLQQKMVAEQEHVSCDPTEMALLGQRKEMLELASEKQLQAEPGPKFLRCATLFH